MIFTSLVCLCRSTLPFCCNFTIVYCKRRFILKLYFLNILWCALWYLYHLLITAFFLFVLIWRTELPCVYHYGCVSQGAKSKYHKHLLFPSRHLRSFLLTEHSHWGDLFWLQRRATKDTHISGDFIKYPPVKVAHIGFLMVSVVFCYFVIHK